MKRRRTAIYARVSSHDGRQENSVRAQLKTLREYAKQRNYTIQGEYCDQMSGARDDRPEFQKMMDACRKRKVDIVLTYRFDRFSRSVKTLVDSLDEFGRLSIDFVSYSESVDTTTSMGRFFYHVISAINSLEREIARERIIHGLQNSTKKSGAPVKKWDTALAVLMNTKGHSLREIAARVGVSYGTVRRYLQAVT